MYDSIYSNGSYVYHEDEKDAVKNFKSHVKDKPWISGKSLILFAWCRGKISEGIDFKDDEARLVCIIGIPHPSLYAADVVLKKQTLNE